ncbi:MAG: PKD domain-containing protein [Gemmataceae bacterium]
MRTPRSRIWKKYFSLERLDDRLSPAILFVTNVNDSGTGSLRQAISAANSNPDADTIIFQDAAAGGTVNLTTMGGTNYGPNAFEITTPITIQGSSTTAETLSIVPTTLMRFFYIAPGGNLSLNRIQLSGGTAQGGAGGLGGGGGGAGMGGAIYNQGKLTIDSSTISGASAIGGNGGDSTTPPVNGSLGAGGGGGGMFGNGGAAGVSVGNSAGGGGGGFFGNGGPGENSSSFGGGGGGTQTNGQSATNGGAGGSQNGGNGIDDNLTVIPAGANGGYGGGGGGSTGRTNAAFGGVGGGGGGSGFNSDLSSSSIGGAGGFGGGGGGGFALGGTGGFGGGGGGSYNVAGNGGSFGGTGSNTSDFSAGAFISAGGGGAGVGGAIFNDEGIVNIVNSTLSGNSAAGGQGGIGNIFSPNAGSGSGVGGAIFTAGGNVTILNSTLTLNQADLGRQLYADRSINSKVTQLQINNTILGQADASVSDIAGSTTDVSGGVNNVIRNNQMTVAFFSNTVTSDPLLGPLQNNGGGIQTHLPSNTSPAIDAGDNTAAAGLTADQRLFKPRIVGTNVDIGAVEVGAVGGTPPVLTAPANQNVVQGTSKAFDVGSLTDSNNSGNYSVTVNWGDGTANTVFTQATVGTLTQQSHTYATQGAFTVSVFAKDVDGTSNTITYTINVAGAPPVLTAPANQNAVQGNSQAFDIGSLSDLNNSGNYSVTVNWGDGTPNTIFSQATVGTLTQQSHTYATQGAFTVSVFATDIDGTSNTITYTINVAGAPPVLTTPAAQTAVKGVSQNFDIGSLSDLNNSGNYTVTVNWGDSTPNTVFTQATVGTLTQQSHTYTPQGSYTVTVFATDVDGTSNTTTFDVNVLNAPPTLEGPVNQTSLEGSNTSFALGTLADLNNSGNYTVTVNWGDGSSNTVFTQTATGTLTAQSHNYIQNGSYTVTVTATDIDGESNTATFNVVTSNFLPAIVPPPAIQTGMINQPVSITMGSFTDPGIADTPWIVSIDFGDGSTPVQFNQATTGTIPAQTHTYSQAGTFTVTVRVTDDVGSSTATHKVVIGQPLGTTFAVGGPTTGQSLTANGNLRYEVTPFGALYSDTVRVAEGDVTGDGVPDLIAGTGPGSVNCFFVIDGVTHESVHGKVPFEQSFTGGIFVAVGDLNGDGRDEIIATADEGGSTRVRVFDGITINPIADFFGIDDANFRGGARAAVADVNNDGVGDLIITAGVGGGPRVAIYNGKSIMQNNPVKIVPDFFAFDPNFRGGVFVAAGDVNGDGFADVIFGAGIGGGPRVEIISGQQLVASGTQTVLANFFAGDPNDRNGVRVTAKNLDGDNLADIVTGAGNGSGTRVRAYLGLSLAPTVIPQTFLNFDAFDGANSGVFVG